MKYKRKGGGGIKVKNSKENGNFNTKNFEKFY